MRTLLFICLLFVAMAHSLPLQETFMTSQDYGAIWSLCDDPGSHSLRGYQNGVTISPDLPRTGDDITVQVRGHLLSPVTSGQVSIQLNLMNMIKINKDLDLCNVLESDVMRSSCPLNAGDVTLNAKAFIPKELPKLPLKGDIKIMDQLGNTVTCIHLDFKLQ